MSVLDDDLKSAFYEIECIRGNWSVRELKRQIGSLYYERSDLSKDKRKLAALTREGEEAADPRLAIRDPYIFEFLGLKPREVISESHLEDQLLDKLQGFLLGDQDSGDVQGIAPDAIGQMKKDFVTAINNPQKLH